MYYFPKICLLLVSEMTSLGSRLAELHAIEIFVFFYTNLWHLTITRDSINEKIIRMQNAFMKDSRPVGKFFDFSLKPSDIFKNVILEKLNINTTLNMWQ